MSLVALCLASSAEGHPADLYGLGPRAIAMGGAATSIAKDSSAAYYNPALLSGAPRVGFELGYSASLPSLRLDGHDVGVDSSHGFQGGALLGGELLDRRVGFALTLALPDDLISRVRTRRESQPRFVLFDNLPQRLVVATTLAVELIDGLSFGAGLTYIASTRGTLEVRGSVSASKEELTRLVSAVDVTFSSVRTPTLGLAFARGPIRLGLTFREQFVLELDLDVKVEGQVTLGDDELVLVEDGSFLLDSFNTDLFSPRQVALGVAYEAETWLVAFDLTYAQWSRFPAPVSRIALDFDLEGLDFEVPIPAAPVEPGLSDILVPRVGLEAQVLSSSAIILRGRAGYSYSPTPTPPQLGRTNYVDSDKHTVSVGVGIETSALDELFPEPLELDLAVALTILEPIEIEKSSPADPVGDYRAGGTILTSSAGVRFLF
ncbi:MAG: hypothetical protein HYV07_33710 [Deltaproteobacteria bacterium]|nr:hypothetical protein [Deltaproteobacteria bacterium]